MFTYILNAALMHLAGYSVLYFLSRYVTLIVLACNRYVTYHSSTGIQYLMKGEVTLTVLVYIVFSEGNFEMDVVGASKGLRRVSAYSG